MKLPVLFIIPFNKLVYQPLSVFGAVKLEL